MPGYYSTLALIDWNINELNDDVVHGLFANTGITFPGADNPGPYTGLRRDRVDRPFYASNGCAVPSNQQNAPWYDYDNIDEVDSGRCVLIRKPMSPKWNPANCNKGRSFICQYVRECQGVCNDGYCSTMTG